MLEKGARALHQLVGILDPEADRAGHVGDEMDAVAAIEIVGGLAAVAPLLDYAQHRAILRVGEGEREPAVAAVDLGRRLDDDLAGYRSEQDGRGDRPGGEAESGVDRLSGRLQRAAQPDEGVREAAA